MTREMLVPSRWCGPTEEVKDPNMFWVNELPKNTYCALWLEWPGEQNYTLPPGYDYYVVSFHLEAIDVNWLSSQASKINSPIILLSDCNYYSCPLPTNVTPYTFYYWHWQLDKMKTQFPVPYHKNIKYKASAFTNRISQSKLLIFTKLAETLPKEDVILTLGTWLEDKNVHYKQQTNNKIIDGLADTFFNKYAGTELKIDGFENAKDNYQFYTANPNQPAYQECALNFTNESFHYSAYESAAEQYIYPGPFLTEKTFKCLLGATSFIPVGQFDTYGTLSKLGFKFDYPFDTKWDRDPRNLNRLESIIKLIDQFRFFSAEELYQCCQESATHNQEIILSNDFWETCEKHNETTIGEILQKFN